MRGLIFSRPSSIEVIMKAVSSTQRSTPAVFFAAPHRACVVLVMPILILGVCYAVTFIHASVCPVCSASLLRDSNVGRGNDSEHCYVPRGAPQAQLQVRLPIALSG